MSLPGYAKATYAELDLMNVENINDFSLYFVVDKQEWFYLDKNDNNTWKPCILNDLKTLTDMTVNDGQQRTGLLGFSNTNSGKPNFQIINIGYYIDPINNSITKLNTDFTDVKTLVNNLNSQIGGFPNLINSLNNTATNQIKRFQDNVETIDPNAPNPKLDIHYKNNPNRVIFQISGYGNPIIIGGQIIQSNNDPITQGFNPDFIGQQWINTNNKDLWIATNYNEQYYGWRKINLDSAIYNSNYSQGREG